MGSCRTFSEEDIADSCECQTTACKMCQCSPGNNNNWKDDAVVPINGRKREVLKKTLKVKDENYLASSWDNSEYRFGIPSPSFSFPRAPCPSSSSSLDQTLGISDFSVPSCSTHPLPTSSILSPRSPVSQSSASSLSSCGTDYSDTIQNPILDVRSLSPENPFLPLLTLTDGAHHNILKLSCLSNETPSDSIFSAGSHRSSNLNTSELIEPSASMITLRPVSSTSSITSPDSVIEDESSGVKSVTFDIEESEQFIPVNCPKSTPLLQRFGPDILIDHTDSATSVNSHSSDLSPPACSQSLGCFIPTAYRQRPIPSASLYQSGSSISLQPCPATFHLPPERKSLFNNTSSDSSCHVTSLPDLRYSFLSTKIPPFRSASSINQLRPVSILRQPNSSSCRVNSRSNIEHRVTFSDNNEIYLDALEDNSDLDESSSSIRLNRSFGV